ncbi:ribonuclease HI [Mangrovimonas sp. AS39]|uniref:ribonuclease HI n=1 Tax=Mangrovimonas futianensis TaxID=2895523 RepID=UPI001E3BDFAA|nr:ribonuclease HI [Mangrovimonas futianensis]MCF1192503.1 ribonuclease HI [Mangrovimonas futianensis]MCF1196167.1 ribonuclease HI [Mangrovimonas futianensis]
MTLNEIPHIELFTDGGAEPNPGKGGFGVILSYKGRQKEFFEGYELTTNNRMELMAVIFGLEQIKTKAKVTVFSDSKYVVDGIVQGWAANWERSNWIRKKGNLVLNKDLWERLLDVMDKHEVTFNWVKGHAGHSENERCDILANKGIHSENKMKDEGYLDYLENIEYYQEQKIEKEGDLCRKCQTPVIKKSPKKRKIIKNQNYYFEYYMFCPNCRAMYMVEEAKKEVPDGNTLF